MSDPAERDAWARLEARALEVQGTRVRTRVSVEPLLPGAPAVLLVPGIGLSGRYARPIARRLGVHFEVHAPDPPGYGSSGRARARASVERLADDLLAYAEAAGLERVALLANSFGCQVAAVAAARAPERISRLILQGPTTAPPHRWPTQLARFVHNALGEPLALGPLVAWDWVRAGPASAGGALAIALGDAIERLAPEVACPTLVVSCERDPISPIAWGRRLAGRFVDGHHSLLLGATHTAVFAAPGLLAQAAVAFLRGEEPPARVARPPRPPRALVTFDSSAAMARALIAATRDEGLPRLGASRPLAALARTSSALPLRARQVAYAAAGLSETLPAREIAALDLEELRRWAATSYPERRFPLVLVGSSHGALTHLAGLLQAPWLPQTFLLGVRDWGGDAGDGAAALEHGRATGGALLARNPGFDLHQMHDPNQDRLMAPGMSYFRVKARRLGPAYEAFLAERLAPGGVLCLVDCGLRWPVTRVGPRHVFQFGAWGGLPPAGYHGDAAALRRFLASTGARRLRVPTPTEHAPEAEWGFAPELERDAARLARRLGARLVRLSYRELTAPSGLVAELFREEYARHGLPADRLLVSSFALLDPWWTLRGACVPYWTPFPVEPAAAALERWLDRSPPFGRIDALLFAHGVRSVGLADVARWRGLLARGERPGELLGVDPRRWPCDLAVYARYHGALRAALGRYPLLAPPPLEPLLERLARRGPAHGVHLEPVGVRAAAA